jgi:hypothetical protein
MEGCFHCDTNRKGDRSVEARGDLRIRSDECLQLEEAAAVRMSSPCRTECWHRLRGAGNLRGGLIQGWRGTGERHTLANLCEPSGF